MTKPKHLPECFNGRQRSHGLPCICDRLRACEQRMFALHPEWTVTGMCKPECAACRRLTELITEWEYGYEKGIDAAREAVERWFVENRDEMTWPEFLATVDAMKEKR